MLPTGGLFGQKPMAPVTPPPTEGLFGKPAAAFPPPPATSPIAIGASRPTDKIDPFTHAEEGMQKECLNLFLMMARELELVSVFTLVVYYII